MANPVPNRKTTSDQAENHKPDDCVPEGRRIGDANNLTAELQSEQADDGKAQRTRQPIHDEQAQAGILQSAGGGKDHCEWKRRRDERGEHNSPSRTAAHFLPQSLESLFTRHPFDPLLAQLARYQVQEDDTDGGTRSSSQDVERKTLVVPRDKDHHQNVIAEGQKKERGVQNAQEQGAKVSGVYKEGKEWTKEVRQTILLIRP